MTSDGGDRPTASFPTVAVAIGVAAMLLIALTSVGTGWYVSNRIKTITQSQLLVLSASQQLDLGSDQRELALRTFIATGDGEVARHYRELTPRLRESLQRLQTAIVLEANRRTFAGVIDAEAQIAAIEASALRLSQAGSRDAAALLEQKEYLDARTRYRRGLSDIQARSRAFVESNRVEADHYLLLGLLANIIALLLLTGTWLLIIRRVRGWARDLRRAQQAAEAATRAKSQFVAVMSHEIRTPLNSVIGFADLMLDDGGLTEPQRRQVTLIQSAGTMLLTIVNDVLDFSKIESGRLTLETRPFAMTMLIDNIVSILRPSAEVKNLRFDIHVDPAVGGAFAGDEDRIRQILLNLINNALKFTDAGGVSLRAAPSPAIDKGVRFEVVDSGIGIADEAQADLFQPFTQSDASISRRFGGTGLGLSISRQLAEAMGGTITVRSRLGEGSTFIVDLPLTPATLDTGIAGGAARVHGGADLLLVEDLPMNRELAVAILTRAGHRVTEAVNGKQALEKAAVHRFDLILMDVQMPVMDGLTATRAIRALPPPFGTVPIVAMTANALPDQLSHYRRSGMDGHVAKPIRQAQLHGEIARLVARSKSEPAVADEEGDGDAPILDQERLQAVRTMIPPDRLAVHVANLRLLVDRMADEGVEMSGVDRGAIAHKVASQAGMLGMIRLEQAARAVEDAGESGTIATALIQAARTAGDQAFAAIDKPVPESLSTAA